MLVLNFENYYSSNDDYSLLVCMKESMRIIHYS